MNVVLWTWIIAVALWVLAGVAAVRAANHHRTWHPIEAFKVGFWFGGLSIAALIFTLSAVARTWY